MRCKPVKKIKNWGGSKPVIDMNFTKLREYLHGPMPIRKDAHGHCFHEVGVRSAWKYCCGCGQILTIGRRKP